MALVTGIANHYTSGSFKASEVDTSLKALVTQLGGVYWNAGVPTVCAGNIDKTNFVAGSTLSNTQLAEPYSVFTISVLRPEEKAAYCIVPCDCLLLFATVEPDRSDPVYSSNASGSIVIAANGSNIGTLTFYGDEASGGLLDFGAGISVTAGTYLSSTQSLGTTGYSPLTYYFKRIHA